MYPPGFRTFVEVTELGDVLCGAVAAGALPRRGDGRAEAVQHRPARSRLLRPEGRPAGAHHPADGARSGRAGARSSSRRRCASRTGWRLSSRNRYLDPAERRRAAVLYAGAGVRSGGGSGRRARRRGAACVPGRAHRLRLPARRSTTPRSSTPTRCSRSSASPARRWSPWPSSSAATRLIDNIDLPYARRLVDDVATRRRYMSHPLFGPEVRLMLQEGDAAEHADVLRDAAPRHRRRSPGRRRSPSRRSGGSCSPPRSATRPPSSSTSRSTGRCEMVEGTGRQQMAQLIEQMSHDDRVDLLRRLRPRVAETICCGWSTRPTAATSPRWSSYPENTAGALMTTDYAWLPADAHAPARRSTGCACRRRTARRSTTSTCSTSQRKLLGVVSLRDLILAPRHALIRDLMETRLRDGAGHRRPRAGGRQELARYDLLAMPVVDDERPAGRHRHARRRDRRGRRGGDRRRPPHGRASARWPRTTWKRQLRHRSGASAPFWLACLFVAELFTFTALSHFDEAIGKLCRAEPVRAAVHLDRRQLRLAGGHAHHARDGSGAGHDRRLVSRAAPRAAHGPGPGPDARR